MRGWSHEALRKRGIGVTKGDAAAARAPRPRLNLQRPDGMNKTEHEFYLILQSRGYAHVYREGLTFSLARIKTRYTPDFITIADEITAWEVKGFWRDDARVKIKVAATLFPWIRFIAVQRLKGRWVEEEIPA